MNDAQRRALGIPRVDTQLYARETGSVIEALATLYEFDRDPATLATLRSPEPGVERPLDIPVYADLADASHHLLTADTL